MPDSLANFTPPDYLTTVPFDAAQIVAVRQERREPLHAPRLQPYRAAVKVVSALHSDWFDFAGPVVKMGRAEDLTAEQQAQFQASLKAFRPWKKGPFELFGTLIDAEWRSDLKWGRLLPHLQPLTGRTVADIGCHNGYFMFRMLDQDPRRVIGFEPVAKHFWNFQLLQNIVRQERLAFELLGVEHIDLYPGYFDTIFCLGILYHHTDPVGLLCKMHNALTAQGELVIDCQGIPGDEPVALTPRGRYAGARGIWFLPTLRCLEHWIHRAGFTAVRPVFAEPLSTAEQRRTAWADVDSLAEFLDREDASLTVEGYPAPWRFYVLARKG